MVDSLLDGLDELACWTEDLQLVVFGCAHHDPRIVLVPVEVADSVCETAVHVESSGVSMLRQCYGKQDLQLGRPILGLLLRLLVANLAGIPQQDAAVVAGTGEDGGVLWVPLQADDVATMTLQAMQRLLEITQIPDTNGLIRRASR